MKETAHQIQMLELKTSHTSMFIMTGTLTEAYAHIALANARKDGFYYELYKY